MGAMSGWAGRAGRERGACRRAMRYGVLHTARQRSKLPTPNSKATAALLEAHQPHFLQTAPFPTVPSLTLLHCPPQLPCPTPQLPSFIPPPPHTLFHHCPAPAANFASDWVDLETLSFRYSSWLRHQRFEEETQRYQQRHLAMSGAPLAATSAAAAPCKPTDTPAQAAQGGTAGALGLQGGMGTGGSGGSRGSGGSAGGKGGGGSGRDLSVAVPSTVLPSPDSPSLQTSPFPTQQQQQQQTSGRVQPLHSACDEVLQLMQEVEDGDGVLRVDAGQGEAAAALGGSGSGAAGMTARTSGGSGGMRGDLSSFAARSSAGSAGGVRRSPAAGSGSRPIAEAVEERVKAASPEKAEVARSEGGASQQQPYGMAPGGGEEGEGGEAGD